MRTIVAGLLILFAVSAPPAGAADGPCARRESRTVAANEQVRVYLRHGLYYGCAYRRGRAYQLGSKHFDCISSGGCGGIQQVRVAGRFVAVSEHDNSGGADQTDTGAMRVIDLETGRHRYQHYVGEFGADAVIGGFRVTATGAVGYVVDRTPWAGADDRHRVLEIWRMDARGRRRVDRGWRIRRDSLRLAGRRFSWVHGARRRATTLR